VSRHVLTTADRRKGGRKRIQTMSKEDARAGGLSRARQGDFQKHNEEVAPEGFWAQSAYLRAAGARLLDASQIQFLRPEDLRAGPGEPPFTPTKQRLVFGFFVWKFVWQQARHIEPLLPTDEEYLTKACQVKARLGQGLELENVLDALWCAPNDFKDETGNPWSPRRQRKLFRSALQLARQEVRAMADKCLSPVRAACGDPSSSITLWEGMPMHAFDAHLPGTIKHREENEILR
jgi:hypothetical protein